MSPGLILFYAISISLTAILAFETGVQVFQHFQALSLAF